MFLCLFFFFPPAPDATIVLNSASLMPDPVEYPGTVDIAMDINTLVDMPLDMEITLDLTVYAAGIPIEVPCLEGFGAW